MPRPLPLLGTAALRNLTLFFLTACRLPLRIIHTPSRPNDRTGIPAYFTTCRHRQTAPAQWDSGR